jgi:hypothetical protein
MPDLLADLDSVLEDISQTSEGWIANSPQVIPPRTPEINLLNEHDRQSHYPAPTQLDDSGKQTKTVMPKVPADRDMMR